MRLTCLKYNYGFNYARKYPHTYNWVISMNYEVLMGCMTCVFKVVHSTKPWYHCDISFDCIDYKTCFLDFWLCKICSTLWKPVSLSMENQEASENTVTPGFRARSKTHDKRTLGHWHTWGKHGWGIILKAQAETLQSPIHLNFSLDAFGAPIKYKRWRTMFSFLRFMGSINSMATKRLRLAGIP